MWDQLQTQHQALTHSSIDTSLSQNRHGVWVQSRQHAIKEEIQVANHDWVDHEICSLLHYIIVRINLNLVKIIQKKKSFSCEFGETKRRYGPSSRVKF